MSTVLALVLLGVAAMLSVPSNFSRTIDYFVRERRKSGLPGEMRNQRLALAAFILSLIATALMLLF